MKKLESPPYLPKANGLAEYAVQTVKHAVRVWKESQVHVDFTLYLQKVLFHHHISACSRGKSPAELVFGRTLQVPIVSQYQQGDDIWLKPVPLGPALRAQYLMTKGHNTSWVLKNDNLTLASNDQIVPVRQPQSSDCSPHDEGLPNDNGIMEESVKDTDSARMESGIMSEGTRIEALFIAAAILDAKSSDMVSIVVRKSRILDQPLWKLKQEI